MKKEHAEHVPARMSFYDPKTGLFTGRMFIGPARTVELNTPSGCKAMPGKYDHRSQRVDLETGEVVAYEAPPDPRARRRKVRQRIASLERRQLRPLRELALNPEDSDTRARLAALDGEIAKQREQL